MRAEQEKLFFWRKMERL